MTPEEIDAFLASSLEDRRLSRGERQDLSARIAVGASDPRDEIRRQAFERARSALVDHPEAAAVLGWLEDVIKATRGEGARDLRSDVAEAHFSPGEECRRAIARLLRRATQTADACVFTITDDVLADAVIEAHRRGVAVRVLADDNKAEDLGSDIGRLRAAGVAVRVDRSPFHMHHKFLVVDGRELLTGSYNWTRGAARDNEENLIVTDDPRLVSPFAAHFERLWDRMGRPAPG